MREFDDRNVSIRYEGSAPPRDLISYKESFLEMSRWANTGGGISAVIGTVGLIIGCVGSLTLLMLLVNR